MSEAKENKNKVTKKPRPKPVSSKPNPSASPSAKSNGKTIAKNSLELSQSSLTNRLLHITVSTDLDDKKDVDELHEQIEEEIEKKLKENGVENCIVFVSGPNIKLNLL